jgi:hypothetical protein
MKLRLRYRTCYTNYPRNQGGDTETNNEAIKKLNIQNSLLVL